MDQNFKVGDRVTRTDGRLAGEKATVSKVSKMGWVVVVWDLGGTGNYAWHHLELLDDLDDWFEYVA